MQSSYIDIAKMYPSAVYSSVRQQIQEGDPCSLVLGGFSSGILVRRSHPRWERHQNELIGDILSTMVVTEEDLAKGMGYW